MTTNSRLIADLDLITAGFNDLADNWSDDREVISRIVAHGATLADISTRLAAVEDTIANGTFGVTQPALAALTLSSSTVVENSSVGTLVGTLSGMTLGSAISLTSDANGRFILSGNNIIVGTGVINYEAATTHSITVLEVLQGSPNSPKTNVFTITVQNQFEQPTLGVLTLSSNSASVGGNTTITINGATPNSVISGSVPDGMVLNSTARTISGTPTIAGTYSFALVETLPDSSNSGLSSTVSIAVYPVLTALGFSATAVVENTVPGSLVATISGKSVGSTLSMVDSAGNRFAISSNNLVTSTVSTDYETATSHSVIIRETLIGSPNSPRDTTVTINVTNVYEQPNLGTLSIPSSFNVGSTINITGATAGSVITGTVPTGWTINSVDRTITISSSAAIGAQSWSLTETLGDSANSPVVTGGSSTLIGSFTFDSSTWTFDTTSFTFDRTS